jgi:Domain of unknown function (DUF4388)
MQNNRFVVVTGHLNNYPLSDLIGILRHQRKSGRLLIEYPKGPATLFFEDGELVDARLNELTGLQAICVLLAKPEAAFNFNPLIRSSQRSIDSSLQRVVCELFGCWDDSAIQIESRPPVRTPELNPASTDTTVPHAVEGRRVEPLALPPAPSRSLGQRSFAIATAVLIVIGISTVIAITRRLQSDSASQTQQKGAQTSLAPQVQPSQSSVVAAPTRRVEGTRNRQSASAEQRRQTRSSNKPDVAAASSQSESNTSVSEPERRSEPAKQTAIPSSAPGAIKVVMQIEKGRVLKASIVNHSPGMDSFEAMALRIARQRRYPASKTGTEAVTIGVNKPD